MRRSELVLSVFVVSVHIASMATSSAGAGSSLLEPGDPWLQLAPGEPLEVRYLSRADELESQSPAWCEPITAATGDLDEDGMPELVVSLDCNGTPKLAVHRGNVDLLFPNSDEARARRAAGAGCDAAFLPDVLLVTSPIAGHHLAVGDMDADGHADVAIGRDGTARIVVLSGDGSGQLHESGAVTLPGPLTAWASGDLNRRDGIPDLAVGVTTPDGSRLLVLEHPNGALRATPEAFELPAGAADIEIAELDGDHLVDVAVAAGDQLLLMSGRDRKLSLDRHLRSRVAAATVTERSLIRPAVALVAGRFRSDIARDLAVLSDDGSLTVLVGADEPFQQWREEALSEVVVLPDDGLRLLRSRTSARPEDDLLVMQPDISTVGLVQADVARFGETPSASLTDVAMDSPPIAVIPMRLNGDALEDLVVLRRGTARPEVLLTAPRAAFVVNDSGDERDDDTSDGVCATDAGTCTLRASINQANQLDGLTQISFSVSSATNRDSATKPVTIDGTSMGMVEVTGSIGLRGGNSTVRGVAVGALSVSFFTPGAHSTNNVIEGNRIGLNATEDMTPGVSIRSPDNQIGGTTSAARNILSALGWWCLTVSGEDTTDIDVKGNWIGTDATGQSAFADFGGVYFQNHTTSNVFGGTESGAGNVVAGVDGMGVQLRYGGVGTLIQGNRIGTTPDGGAALGNREGMIVWMNGVTIGGTTPSARNLISGNGRDGIRLNTDANDTVIQGNFIGTDVAGSRGLGNGFHGIMLYGTSGISIGGTTDGAGNVISDNGYSGIALRQSSNVVPEDVVIQGNLVGTDASGTIAIGNGVPGSSNWGDGITIDDALRPVVGGTDTAARNVISGNVNHGIEVRLGELASIQGNLIGTGVDGASPLGNGASGIYFGNTTPDVFDGLGEEKANTIAFNGKAGVFVASGATGVTIRYNKIFDNDGLGIALNFSSVQNNDSGDTDGGANEGQNYPVLSSATETVVSGTLDSEANTAYTIDVYTNSLCDPSGHGEAETWLGETTVTTDADGHVAFSITYGSASGFLAATATNPEGNTSELSECLEIAPDTTNRTVRITAAQPQVEATVDLPLEVEVLKEDGTVDAAFSGSVDVWIAAGSTTGIGALVANDGLRHQQVTVPVSQGTGTLKLVTPQEELTNDTIITPATTLAGTAVITAELDQDSSSTISVEVTSPLDLTVSHIQVMQGTTFDIQNDLIWDHRTMFRFIVKDLGTAPYKQIEGLALTVDLVDGNGQPVEGSPWHPRWGKGVGSNLPDEPFVLKRSYDDGERIWGADAINAYRQVKTRHLSVTAELDAVYPDRDPSNDTFTRGPFTFKESRPVTILYAKARFDDGSQPTALPDDGPFGVIFNHFEKAMPVSLSKMRFVELPAETHSESPLTLVDANPLAFWLNRPDEGNVVGLVYLVDDSYIEKIFGPGVRGVTNRLGGTVAVVNTSLCAHPKWTCETFTHEVGHMYSLGDTYVSDRAVPNPDINPRVPGYSSNYGNYVSPGAPNLLWGKYAIDPEVWPMFDFMGNANRERWTNSINWEHMKTRMRAVTAKTMITQGSVVLVRGSANLDGSGSLDTCYTLTNMAIDTDGEGSHTVETLDSAGVQLASVAFTPDHRVPHVEEDAARVDFGYVLPFSEAVKTIRFRTGGTTLATIAVSAHDPQAEFMATPTGTVDGTVTVTWQGSDPDGDPLVYSLFYSPDGELRIPLVEETNATSFAWDSTWVPSGNAPRLTLVASDGVRATVVDSATFTVADQPPNVSINLPVDGDVYAVGFPVPLRGSVIDPEDGLVGTSDLTWSSDRDGDLGQGSILSVTTLSEGVHVITADASDSSGNTGSDSVTITVTSGPMCTLDCSASVPASALVGTEVEFTSTLASSNCPDPVILEWAFGDGAVSSRATTQHAYTQPGTHRWQLSGWSSATSCELSGTITVTVGQETHHYLIPASAHAPGAEGTQWVTDAVLHNPGADTVWATMYFHARDENNVAALGRSFAVAPAVSMNLADVVLTQFGEANAAAALRVGATGALQVSSRTYNDAPEGTYGQFIPGFAEGTALGPGEEARLIQLTSNSSFRTNIGLASAADTTTTVQISLYAADSTLLAVLPVQLKPRSYLQLNNVFGGMGDIDDGFAVVRSDTSSAAYLTYASVVDNGSGDPVYVYPVTAAGSDSGALCGLDQWQDLNSDGALGDSPFLDAIASDDMYVMFGYNGAMISSPDAMTWSVVDCGTDTYLEGGVWNGNLFVIVGKDGTIVTSPDGASWTVRDSGFDDWLRDIAWGNGLFVAVGDNDTILTSPDAVNWTSRSSPLDDDEELWGVAWHGGRWVAVGTMPTWMEPGSVLTSTDGVHWTLGTLPEMPGWPYRVDWLNGRFVTTGFGGYLASSQDGISWTAHHAGTYSDLSNFIYNGETYSVAGLGAVFTSTNLESWTRWDTGPPNKLLAIIWTGERHVVGGANGTVLTTTCQADSLVVATTANAPGLNQTHWTTDLELHNPSTTPTSVQLELLKRDTANPDPVTVDVPLAARQSLRMANPLQQLFQHDGTAALRLTPSSGELSASSRTYNTATTGTFGQFIPAVPRSHAIAGTAHARLVQLSRSADRTRGFRTNIGFVNLGNSTITVVIELYSGDGTSLGQTTVLLRTGEHRQLTDVFGTVTSGDVPEGYAVLYADSEDALYLAYASVVDNRSGDPVYIPAQ